MIRSNAPVTVLDMAETLVTFKKTIEREMKKLRGSSHITREGGNRYGHMEDK